MPPHPPAPPPRLPTPELPAPTPDPLSLHSSHMTTRNAEDAELSDASQGRSITRPRLETDVEPSDPTPATGDTASPPVDEAPTPPGGKTSTRSKDDPPTQQEDRLLPLPELDAVHYLVPPTPNALDIHGWDSISTLDNLSTIQQAKWRAEKDPKVLVYKAYGGRIDDKEEVTNLCNIIKTNLRLDSNPTVAVPIPEDMRNHRDGPPFCTLVKDITEENTKLLIKKVTPHLPTPESTIPADNYPSRGSSLRLT